jgi:Tol biopolymer transport system component
VAIKVLRSAIAGDPGFLKRFEREAHAISNLNHPRICTVHDVGRQDGLDYLVMEHLVGQTLADCLTDGPLPIALVLEYGIQIGQALSSAHHSGLVHRDLKPANIMVVKDGIKILDFGLAKFGGPWRGDGPEPETLTDEAVIIGTPAYMAPEQLEGKPCDHRTDIFALGVVLYEMSAGKRPFAGESRAALITEIMRSEPPVLESAPPHFAHLVERCLVKDSAGRWQSAQDLAAELRWIQQAGESASSNPAVTRAKKGGFVAWLVAMSATATLLGALALYRLRPPASVSTIEFDVAPPPDTAFGSEYMPAAVSPDGRYLVVRAVGRDGKANLWLRTISEVTPRLLPGTTGAAPWMFWSPDSRRIAFLAGGRLRKIDVEGGPSVEMFEFHGQGTGSWSRTGDILLATQPGDLYLGSEQGGPVKRIEPTVEGGPYRFPVFLPDGRHFLFSTTERGRFGIYVKTLDEQRAKLVVPDAIYPELTRPPGSTQDYILFERKQVSMGQAFDLEREKTIGDAFALGTTQTREARPVHVSLNGVLLHRSFSNQSVLVWMDRKGTELGKLGGSAIYRQLSLSPDGSTLATANYGPDFSDIWLMDLQRGAPAKLTPGGVNHYFPVWSPLGDKLAYSTWDSGNPNLYVRNVNSKGADRPLLRSATVTNASSWSPNGRYLAYWASAPKTHYDIWIVPLGNEDKTYPWLATEHNELQPDFSPDGRWIAYTSDESGRQEVYVREFNGEPAGSDVQRISIDGGSHPRWRQDGKEIFFLAPDGKVMAAVVTGSSGLKISLAREMFQTRVRMQDVFMPYAVAGNGERFLISTPPPGNEFAPITVILNWRPSNTP